MDRRFGVHNFTVVHRKQAPVQLLCCELDYNGQTPLACPRAPAVEGSPTGHWAVFSCCNFLGCSGLTSRGDVFLSCRTSSSSFNSHNEVVNTFTFGVDRPCSLSHTVLKATLVLHMRSCCVTMVLPHHLYFK